VWVEILTTQEVVAVGLRTILEAAASALDITTTGPVGDEPDVVLYDVIHLKDGDASGLGYWLKQTASTVIAIDRTLRPELGARAKEQGVEWAIDLGITGDQLVAVIADAIGGNLEDNTAAHGWDAGGYLGSHIGLTPRESKVLALVAQGLSNQEIAETLILSINTVKTQIRSTYRKIGVAKRPLAMAWAVHHGFSGPVIQDGPPDPKPLDTEGALS
jgi:NarL family two-component system response regulator LiaR